MSKYRVWTCSLVLHPDAKTSIMGFDSVPRKGAVEAVEKATGMDVLSCFSGWGGTLNEIQEEIVDEDLARTDKTPKVYEKTFFNQKIVIVNHGNNIESGYPKIQVVDTCGNVIPLITILHQDEQNFTVQFGAFGEEATRCSGTILYCY